MTQKQKKKCLRKTKAWQGDTKISLNAVCKQ